MSSLKTTGGMNLQQGFFSLRNLRQADVILLLLVFALALIGVATQYSAIRGTGAGIPYHEKQATFFFLGLALACILMCFDYRLLVSLAPLLYAVALGLLVLVIVIGVEKKGGQRWLEFGVFRLQPSEPTKLALIFFQAWFLTHVGVRIRRFPYFVLAFIIAALPAALIVNADLSTAAVLIPITFMMVFTAGARYRHLIFLVLCGSGMLPVAWQFLSGYRRNRLLSFIDPTADPTGTGYQSIQSMISVGSGGPSGKGFMQSSQTELQYLPEHRTDFIFSLFAEEHGFVGSIVLLTILVLFLLRGLAIARDCPHTSGSALAVGIVILLGFHTFVNIAITIGLMPVTGLPLPFLTYGGSFYMTTMACVGVLLSVHVRRGVFDR